MTRGAAQVGPRGMIHAAAWGIVPQAQMGQEAGFCNGLFTPANIAEGLGKLGMWLLRQQTAPAQQQHGAPDGPRTKEHLDIEGAQAPGAEFVRALTHSLQWFYSWSSFAFNVCPLPLVEEKVSSDWLHGHCECLYGFHWEAKRKSGVATTVLQRVETIPEKRSAGGRRTCYEGR